ncbi:RING finger protein 145 [Latimeria chalumnae]|uniref:RING finger protein 145 n=1 Tax=Latimeria chalumnae TaxID=7897 RepID=UPI00313E6B79
MRKSRCLVYNRICREQVVVWLKMWSLEEVGNIVLRVPSLILLNLLYNVDVQVLIQQLRARSEWMLFKYKFLFWNLYCGAYAFSLVVLLLPVRYLVRLYLCILTALLLYVGHQTSRDYVQRELESAYDGTVYRDPLAVTHLITALTGHIIVSTLCSFLMKTRQLWLFLAPALPLLARLCLVPLPALPMVNNFAMVLTILEVLSFAASNLFVPYNLVKHAFQVLIQVEEVYGLVNLGRILWKQLAFPLLFLVFWLVLFVFEISSFLKSWNNLDKNQGFLFIFLTSMAKCSSTPYSLLGLAFTVSYVALVMLNLCKFYLAGYGAFPNENVMHRGVTEGVTLLLLSLQTGLMDLQVPQRTFLLSIILFIVVTSTLQSMIEITDPIILSLGASHNRSFWRHFRGISMCLFLLVFPCYMAYKIFRFFHMDFWLLILVSSCILTSLQATGTIIIYLLFIVELLWSHPIESLDEIIYYVNAVSRVLEFLLALCVVTYGSWESLFGEWSWVGASVIIIHSYFNVWLRAQSGWKSFLLRMEAAKKISSLPRATARQLRDNDDVCAICFQEMIEAVLTPCCHFFHAGCLRKWLYVQDTCPLCHQPVKPLGQNQTQPSPSGEERDGDVGHFEAGTGASLGGEAGTLAQGEGQASPGQGEESEVQSRDSISLGEEVKNSAPGFSFVPLEDATEKPSLEGIPIRYGDCRVGNTVLTLNVESAEQSGSASSEGKEAQTSGLPALSGEVGDQPISILTETGQKVGLSPLGSTLEGVNNMDHPSRGEDEIVGSALYHGPAGRETGSDRELKGQGGTVSSGLLYPWPAESETSSYTELEGQGGTVSSGLLYLRPAESETSSYTELEGQGGTVSSGLLYPRPAESETSSYTELEGQGGTVGSGLLYPRPAGSEISSDTELEGQGGTVSSGLYRDWFKH